MFNWMFMMILGLGLTYNLSKRKPAYRFFFFIFSQSVSIVYFIWRLTIIPINYGLASFLFGCILYFAEAIGLLTFLIFQYLFSGNYRLRKINLDVYEKQSVPFVDILICTYNEPLYLLEMTIAAACNLDYPSNRFCIHLLDDGQRSALRKKCKAYGIHYITRSNNYGAKAGNINHALELIHGDLFAVLDADMIVQPSFLKHTVGYFIDPKVAFVQTPQVYYNQDVYQYNLNKKIPNEQDFFMRDIQKARAARNAVLHVGTNAVFRLAYVKEIGNYPTYSITEDMAVGMALQAQGYHSIFINEELVYGLSATTLPELVKQRDRWCRGNLQVLRHVNPLFTKGLTLAQKIVYFDGVLYWFCHLQKMIFILCPLLYLIFDLTLLEGSLLALFTLALPYYLAQFLMSRLLSPKTRKPVWGHYYEMVMAPFLSLSIIKEIFHLKASFQVTSKETIQTKATFQYPLIISHLILIILTLGAWMLAFIRLSSQPDRWYASMLNIFWSFYNFTGLLIAIRVAWQKPLYRKTERLNMQKPIPVRLISHRQSVQASIVNLSGQGCGLNIDIKKQFNDPKNLLLLWDGLIFPCQIIRQQEHYLALQFINLSPEHMCQIMKYFCQNMSCYYHVETSQEYC